MRNRKKNTAVRKMSPVVTFLLVLLLALGTVIPVLAGIPVNMFITEREQGDRTASNVKRQHWNVGDTIERKVGGENYRFRCIDEDYSDEMGYHRQAALFLCDTVIPADFGSKYEFETPEGGEHGYVFYPGPIVNFGDSNDYKYSKIRSWLKEAEPGIGHAEPIYTGVFRAYSGSTQDAAYSSFDGGLKGSYIGSQKMTDSLFVLSVDEAFRYRKWLWRFDGAAEENPDTQYGPYSKGYWLRNPAGDRENHDTDMVYIVDLVNGRIRPAPIAPAIAEGETDAELQVTGTTGVRPAFVLPQK